MSNYDTFKAIRTRHHEDFLSAGATKTTREAYLVWVARWKADYRELTDLIRSVKGTRKQFRYAYRTPQPMATEKRRTKIGENPNFIGGGSTILLNAARAYARRMMAARAAAKAASAEHKKAQKAA